MSMPNATISTYHLRAIPGGSRPLRNYMESVCGSDTTREISASESRRTVHAKDWEPLPKSWQPPKQYVLGLVFKVLCIIAVSRTSLNHWEDTRRDEWKQHTKAVINRFQYSNITAGLILTTTAVLLSSHPPVTLLMSYDTPASYILALVASCAALLSVISGAVVIVMYETGTTHYDMGTLKVRQDVPLSMTYGASFGAAIFIACFFTGNILVKVMVSLCLVSLFVSGVLALDVLMFVGKPGKPLRLGYKGNPKPNLDVKGRQLYLPDGRLVTTYAQTATALGPPTLLQRICVSPATPLIANKRDA
ncbi:hypothetical protein K503DRAFT_801384 [Rhizopogon vinicolor AM-OR11-026]|uniref:Uncharacterized protein n=1 Tax=Rhizopogon vinicolor AM-OR11-026 TaxID=1314800 RepID=A0A1B7MXC3_9AGAM|nr:hypothetical protein K503DRAFT_801384 [Rhizopogon vinicolor AM-OR11-026]